MKVTALICLLFAIGIKTQPSCDQVPFIDRAGWGARPPVSITNLAGKPLSFYVIHHTYEPASCYDDQTCASQMRGIQNFHLDDRGWADIGYHFLVGENGKVYEGRGWDREGAHSPGFNNDGYGICIIGDFSVASPNETALNVLRLWMACGIERGYVKENYVITHRQSQVPGYTTCPGNGTFNVVKTWPRFCSFQNSGGNLTGNVTQVSLARTYCAKELDSDSSNSIHYLPSLLNLFLLKLTHLLIS